VILKCTVNGKKKPEAETGICSHDVSLNMVGDLFGRGRYVKYIKLSITYKSIKDGHDLLMVKRIL
jgi:hypothetical protein